MTKAEIVDQIAADADISKAAAGRALDSALDSITKTLTNGDAVTLVGFGTFTVSKRAARKGRNPQTGEEISIAAAKVPRFKPGKALKDTINKK
jgi:DNA-binding protein HU-beta